LLVNGAFRANIHILSDFVVFAKFLSLSLFDRIVYMQAQEAGAFKRLEEEKGEKRRMKTNL